MVAFHKLVNFRIYTIYSKILKIYQLQISKLQSMPLLHFLFNLIGKINQLLNDLRNNKPIVIKKLS